jgi:hypothetical protein
MGKVRLVFVAKLDIGSFSKTQNIAGNRIRREILCVTIIRDALRSTIGGDRWSAKMVWMMAVSEQGRGK